MDLAEFRHMIGPTGPVRGPERWVLYTIIPVSLINSDEIEIRPPYLTSVPTIMDRTGIKTARTVNKRLDALAATGWLSIERPSNGTLAITPMVPETCVCDCRTTNHGEQAGAVRPGGIRGGLRRAAVMTRRSHRGPRHERTRY
jgi:hypothetical protein